MILMNNLTTKQKIIIGAILSVMIVVIGIYGYSMLGQEDWEQDILVTDENLENVVENQEKAGSNINQNNEMVHNTSKIEQNVNDQQGGSEKFDNSSIINGYENLEGRIVVHITGAVQKTGILVLPEGARIADAINAAGGNTQNADLNEVNLAYVLQDGQKIYIPTKEDKVRLERKVYIMSGSGNNVIEQTVNAEGNLESEGDKKVNINIATQNELENLPGIGPSIAGKIIEYREQNGRFDKIEDVQNVKGIGDAKFEKIKEQIVAK